MNVITESEGTRPLSPQADHWEKETPCSLYGFPWPRMSTVPRLQCLVSRWAWFNNLWMDGAAAWLSDPQPWSSKSSEYLDDCSEAAFVVSRPCTCEEAWKGKRGADTQCTLHTAQSLSVRAMGPSAWPLSHLVYARLRVPCLICGHSFPFVSSHHFIEVEL